MTQADRVHSTPPTNTPIDTKRRRFLSVAAGGAVAAAIPAAALAGAPAVDPIYAAIERYKMLSAEYTVAVDRRAPLEDDDPDLWEAEHETSRTSAALFEQMDVIFSFQPSTVAGVADS